MNEFLQNFVEGLREELKQYGELLALLELQQTQVVRRLADELLETVSAVNAQGDAIQMARREREQRQRELAPMPARVSGGAQSFVPVAGRRGIAPGAAGRFGRF